MFRTRIIGLPKRGDLAGQHQRAPEVARVGDLDDQIGVVASASTSRVMRSSSLSVPSSAFTPGRVDDVADLGADERAPVGDRDGRARIVGDGDVAARQPAEDDALADVGLADERDPQRVRPQAEDRGLGGGVLVDDVTGHLGTRGARVMPE